MKHKLLVFILFVFGHNALHAEFLVTKNGMVSSRSDISSEVGRQILADGGNAVDAAVATAFALAVTYPSAGNLGGGGFILVSLANGEVYAQDNREKAPAAAHRDMFLDAQGNVDRNLAVSSLQASGTPGSVAGLLDALERFGTMTRQEVMAPAIKLAEEGFILNEDLVQQFQDTMENFRQYPASLAKFSKDGEPYQVGDLWVQTDLANTLKLISDQGRDGFYKGRTAELIVAEMQRNNGVMTMEDLAAYQPVWREPVHGTYRGYDIWSMPAPSSGGVLLVQMLNMLEPYNLKQLGWGTAPTVHLMIEAERRAYADRAEFLGDPDFVDVPTQMLTSKEYARTRFEDFDPLKSSDSANIGAGSWPEESPQTTHFSVIDNAGNTVSMTTTLNRAYGNRIVVPETGILMNNEMDDFSSKPNVPNSYGLIGRDANQIAPNKRMLSSMAPTIVTQDGKPVLITGAAGGSLIITTVLQIVLNVIDHGMNAEDAVASPRVHHQWTPDIVRYEPGALDEATAAELTDMGHKGLTGAGFGMGNTNSIKISEDGLEGMSDPREEGGVAGY